MPAASNAQASHINIQTHVDNRRKAMLSSAKVHRFVNQRISLSLQTKTHHCKVQCRILWQFLADCGNDLGWVVCLFVLVWRHSTKNKNEMQSVQRLQLKWPAARQSLQNGMCWRGITQFYLPPTRLSTNGMSQHASTP